MIKNNKTMAIVLLNIILFGCILSFDGGVQKVQNDKMSCFEMILLQTLYRMQPPYYHTDTGLYNWSNIARISSVVSYESESK